jgi:ribose-phosphate pyrophosphokinase
MVIDIHAPDVLRWFDGKGVNVTAMELLGRHLAPMNVDLVLSPDKGSIERAKVAAGAAGADFDYFDKTRLSGSQVEMADKPLEVRGKTVAIVDDIIATGGTMVTAKNLLKEKGAVKVYAACTHGLYTNNAYLTLEGEFDHLISTDTIPSETAKLSIAPVVAEKIRELL